MSDKSENTIVTCLTAIMLLPVVIMVVPILIFWAGYFSGWILMQLSGGPVTDAFNTLLMGRHTIHMTDIPYITGALAVIGSYFKNTSSK